MFLAAEVTRTFTATEFLFALFQALAFAGTMIWVKVVLYRRRMREDEANRLQRQREIQQAGGRWHFRPTAMAPSIRSSRFAAASRTLRKRERKLRKRLNGAPARTNDSRLGSREMPLKPTFAIQPTMMRRTAEAVGQ